MKLRIWLLLSFIVLVLPCKGFTDLKPVVEAIEQSIKTKDHSTPFIIGIGGCPGVGKSTLALWLKTELEKGGIRSAIISLDHYGRTNEERKQLNGELDPRRIHWSKLHDTMKSIVEGSSQITKPFINQLTYERGVETIDMGKVDCILFEGTYTLGDFTPIDFLQYVDLGIYLETSLENLYAWKWEREFKKVSPRTSTQFYKHMIEIVKDFAFHVYPTRKNADFILSKDLSHHYTLVNSQADVKEPDFTELRLEVLTY